MRSPDFWYPQDSTEPDKGFVARILPLVLFPESIVYNALGQARRAITKPYCANVCVVCIGNLTAGGTGKTPMAIAVARKLMAQDKAPFFLTRGYGGGELAPRTSRDGVYSGQRRSQGRAG